MGHRSVVGALVSLMVAACSAGSPSGAMPPHAARVSGGCGATGLYRGGSPAWTATANPPTFLVAATGHAGDVTAFLFGYPLRAGQPTDRQNKILWVVRQPRNGAELVLSGRPLGRSAPVVRFQRPADSSPGEIYPSIVDVPTAGCWEFTLRWNGNHDVIDLPYGPT